MPNIQPSLESAAEPASQPESAAWQAVADLLRRAAELAVAQGAESEPFMAEAWAAYLEARPGFREVLEHRQLSAQLASLRARGQLAQA